MPSGVLFVLSAIVGAYVLFVVGSAVAFFRIQRSKAPRNGAEAPFVSVVIPVRSPDVPLDDLLDTLRMSNYPADRYEVLVPVPDETEHPSLNHSTTSKAAPEPPLQFIVTGDPTPLKAHSDHVADQASGDILVTLPPRATLSSEWLSTVAAHTGPNVRRLTTAVTYEHNDRFLPRLQALEQIGRTAASVGAKNGLHSSTQAKPPSTDGSGTSDASPDLVSSTADPQAQIRRPAPATTLGTYVETSAQRFLNTFRQSGRTEKFATALYWLTHTTLLVAGAVAVALPTWRQPVLLAFLAKMGADLVLAVPAARNFGQRELLRSIVPTELFLILAVPASGLLGAWTRLRNVVRSD